MVELKNPEKYPKLISRFERDTGKNAIWHNNLTGNFEKWLNQKIELKNGYICDDPNCPKFGHKFKSKRGLAQHKSWYNREYKPISKDSPILEFFSNFLKEHAYFSRNLIIGIYKDTVQPPADEYDNIRKSIIESEL